MGRGREVNRRVTRGSSFKRATLLEKLVSAHPGLANPLRVIGPPGSRDQYSATKKIPAHEKIPPFDLLEIRPDLSAAGETFSASEPV